MTREEILEKSRKENNGTDEREQQVFQFSGHVSKAFGLMLCSLIVFINQITRGPEVVSLSAWAIFFGIHSCENWATAIKLKKPKWFILAILMTALFLVFFWFYLQHSIKAG